MQDVHGSSLLSCSDGLCNNPLEDNCGCQGSRGLEYLHRKRDFPIVRKVDDAIWIANPDLFPADVIAVSANLCG